MSRILCVFLLTIAMSFASAQAISTQTVINKLNSWSLVLTKNQTSLQKIYFDFAENKISSTTMLLRIQPFIRPAKTLESELRQFRISVQKVLLSTQNSVERKRWRDLDYAVRQMIESASMQNRVITGLTNAAKSIDKDEYNLEMEWASSGLDLIITYIDRSMRAVMEATERP